MIPLDAQRGGSLTNTKNRAAWLGEIDTESACNRLAHCHSWFFLHCAISVPPPFLLISNAYFTTLAIPSHR
jgi:hypothetical protein